MIPNKKEQALVFQHATEESVDQINARKSYGRLAILLIEKEKKKAAAVAAERAHAQEVLGAVKHTDMVILLLSNSILRQRIESSRMQSKNHSSWLLTR